MFTGSKSAVGVFPLVLIVSTTIARIRRPAIGIALALSVLIAFNVLSVGSVFFAPVRNLIDWILPDPTFTGRTEIWEFVIDRIAQRPIAGYGYAAFWSTPEVVYGVGANTGWATVAGHAHNGYLDLALTIGIAGAALVTLWLVVLPLIDFYRSPHEPSVAPLKMLFLRVCLFAAYESCFESMLIQEGALGLFLFMSAFGLRFLSLSRVAI
jgi:O-antigen ligase